MDLFFKHLILYNNYMPYDEIEPISVSDAASLIQGVISESFYQISIIGEVAGFRPASSGHWYFNLKDNDAVIAAAVFRSNQFGMPKIKDGDEVIASGRIDYYEKGGKITFIISKLTLKGDGELLALIEKRKEYYKSLGWFDIDKKKQMPKEIRVLGIVTSATGAALQDILNITKRRAPGLNILIFPCAVQGECADITIASRIRQANNFSACDILIVGRGGGSQEDLACFSSDAVIEAIHVSDIPIISAVGHEIDWPISDFAADFRAPTPSAAAELATETIYRRKERLEKAEEAIKSILIARIEKTMRMIAEASGEIEILREKIFRLSMRIPDVRTLTLFLKKRIENADFRAAISSDDAENSFRNKLKNESDNFIQSMVDINSEMKFRISNAEASISTIRKEYVYLMKTKIEKTSISLKAVSREVKGLSPLAILSRGYAVVENEDGSIIRDSKKIKPGDIIKTKLYKGEFYSVVKEGHK